MSSARNNRARPIIGWRRAFTLLEVMLAVTILALIAGSI